jgi:hypothetical protein
MTRWEYATLGWAGTHGPQGWNTSVRWSGPDGTRDEENSDEVERLNEAGKNGWDVVGITTSEGSNTAVSWFRNKYLLKRIAD